MPECGPGSVIDPRFRARTEGKVAITTHDPKTRPAGRTSVGMKVVMAITGVLFLLFLLAHMYGNLKVFSGQAAFDGYAHHL
jgi:succinate dehydrogenase / fumarate reductase cytochrome b subunit